MTRNYLGGLALGMCLAVLAGCGGGEPTAKTGSAEPVVDEARLPDFVTEIERLVNGAAERVLAQGSGDTARSLRFAAGRRVADGEPLERELEVAAQGLTGRVAATGLAFTRPWPARYEMAFELADFAEAETLTATGALLYNFIRDDREATAQSHGLFRARLTLSGSFAGRVDLHGEMTAGKITSLAVLSGGTRAQLTFGSRAPRAVVTYVATVAGTGNPGAADGGRNVGELNEPAGVVVDRSGRVFVADTGNKAVRELSPNGELSTLATTFEEPWDLGFDGLGLLVVSDRTSRSNEGQGPISRAVTDGALEGLVIRTIAKVGNAHDNGLPYCTAFWCDGRSPLAHMTYAGGIDVDGGIVTVAQRAVPESLRLVTPDGTAMTLRRWTQGGCTPETPGAPYDVVRGRTGELFFTTDCHAVWALRQDGTLEAVAGTPTKELGFADGRGPAAKFSYPAGLVSDGEYLYLTEASGSRIRRIEIATGATLRIAGCLDDTPGFDCVLATGFRDGPGDYAQFHNPENLALDPWGDLYVADTDNHAIRFVRLATDPERRPEVSGIQPIALQRGAVSMLTLRGRDLGLVRTVDLGAGVAAEVVERSAKRVRVWVQVASDAPTGAHALTVGTPFGNAVRRDGMALNVLGEHASLAQVRTIAGTGDRTPGVQDIVPAETAQFGFAGGIAAIDRERILVADPLEQRIKLIATKPGAARELLELAAYEAGGQLGLTILQGIEGFEDIAGSVLGAIGADNFTSAPREEILRAIEQGLDAICSAAQSDCDYLALPWAGVLAAPGNSGGFRLGAALALPSDVAVAGDRQFLIADTGNRAIKTVGIDFSGADPKPAPFQVANADYLQHYPLAVVSTAGDTALAATSADSTLARLALRDGSSVLSPFAGVSEALRCRRGAGDVRHPLGVPMGMARGNAGTFVADPYCGTIWVVADNGEARDIRGELKPPFNPLPDCSDGPLIYATFGKPMDVAVDAAGNVWVVDPACNNVRVIKPVAGDDLRAALDEFSGGVAGWFDTDVTKAAVSRIANASLGEFAAARMWVSTVAGSADGEAGFRDGVASDALFDAPISLAIAEEDGKTYVFVSDAGNRRIRLIDLAARVETTSRRQPPRGALPSERSSPPETPADADLPLDPYNEGIVHAAAVRWVEAAEAFVRAIALDPQDLDAQVQLGYARLQLAQHVEAIDAFRAALRLDARDEGAHAGLAAGLAALGRYEDLAAAARAWTDIAPDSADAHLAYGIAATHLDDYDGASAALEQAVLLDADRPEAHFSLGVAELALQRYESAAQRFRATIELDEQASGAYTNLGVVLLALEREAEALAALDAAVRLNPASAQARFNRGVAYLEMGRNADAQPELAALRELDAALAAELERRIAR